MHVSGSLRRWAGVLVIASLGQPAAAAVGFDEFTGQLAALINAYRQDRGLQPLDLAEDLVTLADEHSASMAQRQRLSHDGFRSRFQRANSKVCVENVAWNYRTPEALLEGWRHSPAHHRNLLDPKVARVGIAMATRYVTFFACR